MHRDLTDALRRIRSLVVGLLIFLTFLLLPKRAEAYPWMIRHGYTQCGSCHADPTGGGLLTSYGRAQGEILMRSHYADDVGREPSKLAEPVLGLFPLPNGLNVGASFRAARMRTKPQTGDARDRFVLMQADGVGQYTLGRFRVSGSLGAVDEGGTAAAVTRGPDAKVVSRTHWVGVDLGAEREVLVRAGRMNLPFGLRSIEHTRFARSETRTDTNTGQEYGLAVDYARGAFRGGAMAIFGNFAVSPDKFRTRGAAAFGEWSIDHTLSLGVSTLVTQTEVDPVFLAKTFRGAHGVFARVSPVRPIVISGEWDLLHTARDPGQKTQVGGVGFLSLDAEPLQGVHLGPTLEVLQRDFSDKATLGAWMSAWWFFLPHLDTRFDVISHQIETERGRVGVLTGILQLHGYL